MMVIQTETGVVEEHDEDGVDDLLTTAELASPLHSCCLPLTYLHTRTQRFASLSIHMYDMDTLGATLQCTGSVKHNGVRHFVQRAPFIVRMADYTIYDHINGSRKSIISYVACHVCVYTSTDECYMLTNRCAIT